MQRLVVDTNVVLDLLHFRDPGSAVVAAALQASRAIILSDASCRNELRRVIAYSQFALDPTQRSLLVERYDALCLPCEPVAAAPRPVVPRCADPDDQKFLELASRGNADYLITKDKALLCMASRMKRLFVIAPPSGYMAA
jgi:putative PIN family toxin of toxin-antitoxin system